MAALMAECSDSTLMSSELANPSATSLANPSIIGVCGVIG